MVLLDARYRSYSRKGKQSKLILVMPESYAASDKILTANPTKLIFKGHLIALLESPTKIVMQIRM